MVTAGVVPIMLAMVMAITTVVVKVVLVAMMGMLAVMVILMVTKPQYDTEGKFISLGEFGKT